MTVFEPLFTRRIGTEVFELEARSPGMARHVVKNFGDDGVRYFAKHAPTRDAARLVGYAKKADSPATQQMLMDYYKKGGAHFLMGIDRFDCTAYNNSMF